jgi:hypothetical protein
MKLKLSQILGVLSYSLYCIYCTCIDYAYSHREEGDGGEFNQREG